MRRVVTPRVIIVMPEQWPRALLRAALREEGYDAIGARSLREAVTYPQAEPGRGPVRLVMVDATAEDADAVELLDVLRGAHEGALFVLVSGAGRPLPTGRWDHVLRRPAAIDDIVAEVRRALPLPPEARHTLDE
jgi:DNA-binding response OmpR family regulator